jgi:hypothetical protein
MAHDELLVETEPGPPPPRPPLSVWPATACLVLAALIWFAYQGWHLQREYRHLQGIRAGQEGALEGAQRRRAHFESIARRVFVLSQQGHAAATLMIQELNRRGVNIGPETPGVAPAAPRR